MTELDHVTWQHPTYVISIIYLNFMKRQTMQNMLETNTSSKASASTWTKFIHPSDGGIKFLHNIQQTLYKAEDHHLSNTRHENQETYKQGLRTTPNANWILPCVLIWSSLIPLLIMTYIMWVSTNELYHHLLLLSYQKSYNIQHSNIKRELSKLHINVIWSLNVHIYLVDCGTVYDPNATDHLCSPCITGWSQRYLFN